jgi:hypothetical protein
VAPVHAVKVTAAAPMPKLARIFRLETPDVSSLFNTSHMNMLPDLNVAALLLMN